MTTNVKKSSYLLEELEFAPIVEAGITYGLEIPE